jgi:hypothetical protein
VFCLLFLIIDTFRKFLKICGSPAKIICKQYYQSIIQEFMIDQNLLVFFTGVLGARFFTYFCSLLLRIISNSRPDICTYEDYCLVDRIKHGKRYFVDETFLGIQKYGLSSGFALGDIQNPTMYLFYKYSKDYLVRARGNNGRLFIMVVNRTSFAYACSLFHICLTCTHNNITIAIPEHPKNFYLALQIKEWR